MQNHPVNYLLIILHSYAELLGLRYQQSAEVTMERFNNLVNKILLNIKVNEETDEDEGYGSIAGGSSRIKSMVWGKCENSVCNLYIAVSKSSRRRKEIRQEDLKIIESDNKECLQIVSFICL